MISLVIPCYNEEDNLEKLLTKISFVLKKFSKEKIEIVIVNFAKRFGGPFLGIKDQIDQLLVSDGARGHNLEI